MALEAFRGPKEEITHATGESAGIGETGDVGNGFVEVGLKESHAKIDHDYDL